LDNLCVLVADWNFNKDFHIEVSVARQDVKIS